MQKLDPRSLIPSDQNSRKHSPLQIERIKQSIKTFGFTVPVIVQGRLIIAGHARTQAAIELKMKEIPVIDIPDLTDEKRRALMIADNKLAEMSEWDTEILAEELQFLKDSDFDLALIGFEDWKPVPSDGEFPVLSDDDRGETRQITFTVHKDQLEIIEQALDKSKAMGEFINPLTTNGNANAITRICELFLGENYE